MMTTHRKTLPFLTLVTGVLVSLGLLTYNTSIKDTFVSWTEISKNNNSSSLINTERRNTLLTACSRLNKGDDMSNDPERITRKYFIIDRINKLIYCSIPKVGSTFLKRLLQITSGIRKEKNPYDVPESMAHTSKLETFDGLRFDEIVDVVSTYKKFLFVRDPYTRLFSGYINKLFTPNVGYFGLRRQAVHLTRSENDASATGCAPFVTFSEFVKTIIQTLKTGNGGDGHFVPMYQLCRPCQMKYDIIGHMEQFSQDVEYVLNSERLENVINVTLNPMSLDKDYIVTQVTRLYNERKQIESCMLFSHAIKLLWRVYQIRGVVDKDKDLPAEFVKNLTLKKEDLIEALLKANSNSDPVGKLANRQEALIEAYQSITPADLKQYRELFRLDFDLFGYDMYPEYMNSTKGRESGFSYFRVD